MLKKKVPRNLYEHVVQEIGLRIMRRQYKPGDTLPNEDELCAHFDVSRGVIREATKVLIQKGLLRVRPKIGTKVRAPENWNLFDPDVLIWKLEVGDKVGFLKNITEVRRTIESKATQLAAERATQSETAAIRHCYDEMARALEDTTDYNYHAYLELDMAFHMAILDACHNELLAQIGHTMRQAVTIARKADIQDISVQRDSLVYHLQMIDAIERGDAIAARQASNNMFDQVWRHIPGNNQNDPLPPSGESQNR